MYANFIYKKITIGNGWKVNLRYILKIEILWNLYLFESVS